MRFRTSDKKTISKFKKEGVEVHVNRIAFEGNSIRYVSRLQEHKTLVLFIHGAPGSGDAFYDYLSDSVLASKADIITMDRLGYGYSEFGQAETSIKRQTESVKTIINTYSYERVILVGHSYGGPIALRLAIEYPEMLKGMVLIAPALDPEHEKILGIAHLGRFRATRWLAPASFKVATDEKFTHVDELQKLDSLDFSQIKTPIVHIHGTKDKLVPFENLAYAESKIASELFKKVIIEDENHFIPWTQQELVTQEIIRLIEP